MIKKKKMAKEKIHIAPIGYEDERIYLPPLENGVDRMILVKRREEELAEEYLERVKNKLDEEGVPYIVEEVDIFDIIDCIRVFGNIIKDQDEMDDVFVNMSTSTGIVAVGASLAAMQWDAEPYYALPESYQHEKDREPGEAMTKGLRDVLEIQKLHIETPSEDLIRIIKFIDDNSGDDDKVRYKEVIDYLEEIGLLDAEHTENKPQSLIRQFQTRYLKDLKNKWEFVKLEGFTRARKIKLTDEGRRYLRMYGYLV